MSSTNLDEKDISILEVVNRLASDLGSNFFELVSYWDDDLFAIGIAKVRKPRHLAYISTWKQPRGSYDLELESAGPTEELSDIVVAGRWESLDYATLKKRIAEHLQEY